MIRFHRRWSISKQARLVIALLAVLLPAASLTSAAPALQSASIEVKMVEFAFQPQSVTITAGQAVSWTNSGAVAHTTTSDLSSSDAQNYWDSTLPSGLTFERVFLNPGTYTYYCKFHRSQGMTGVVIVQAAGGATASPTATATATAVPGTATPTPTGTPPTPTATVPGATATATAPAAQPSFFITSPTEGQVITGTSLLVTLEVNNVTLRPTGAPNRPGEGHFSLFLDSQPEVQVADKTYTFQGLAAGTHALRVELRQNDNTPLTPPLQATVNFRSNGGQAPATATVPPPPTATRPAAPPTTPPGAAATATVGLPKTGDGSYRDPGAGQPAGWLFAMAAGLGIAAILLRRAQHTGA